MLKFGNKEFRNIQEQVEKNAKDIEELKEEGVPGGGGDLPSENPTDDGQILIGNTNGTVEWSTETIYEFANKDATEGMIADLGTSIGNLQESLDTTDEDVAALDNRVTALENAGGSVDNVVEFEDDSLIGYSITNPKTVSSTIMTKLQDPETVIYYNNTVYHYERKTNNIIIYRSIYLIPNETSGKGGITNFAIWVRTVADTNYAAGIWTRVENMHDFPTTLGTNYTEDGNYIWVANKSGTTKTSAWQKYTPGSGGDTDLSNYYTKTESDDKFADKSTFNTTIMGINNVLDEIPNTYATSASIATLEATVMGEISGIESSEPMTGFPTQDFKIDSNGNYFKISNVTGSYEELAPEVVDLGNFGSGLNYENIYNFFKNQILRVTHAGGRGRIFVEPGWNTFGDSGTNGNKLWMVCLNSGIDVGTFNDPFPKAFIVEYVNGVLTLEMILRNGVRGILVINENTGEYITDGFQQITYGGGGITTTDAVTDNGQILIGNVDGTYNWTTETYYELVNRITALETVVNNITYYEGEVE